MKLELITGDVEASPQKENKISVSLAKNNAHSSIIFEFENVKAEVPLNGWQHFLDQVNQKHISQWREPGMPEPIGNPQFREIFNHIWTNSAYQLFLASVDIAKQIELTELINIDYVNANPKNLEHIGFPYDVRLFQYLFDKLNNKLIGSLFILPYFSSINVSSPAISELIQFNQLGEIAFFYEGQQILKFLYRPYFPPFAFKGELSNEAKEIQKIIGNLKKNVK